jgi:TonB family protein
VDGQGSRTAGVWKEWEGQVIGGRFHPLQYLGGSDHSAVFLTDLGEQEPRRAAIKLIAEDSGTLEGQLSGWKVAAELSHPHLIRLFRMGRGQLANTALLYVVMEYAEENLSQILPDRPLTPAESHEMLAPVLDVLAYLHGKGLVHGHLKPANIMAVNDQLKISSDRLTKIGESIESIVRPGQPSVYDAPETTRAGMSPAADVWSLGMTLVECLTQRLPPWEKKREAEPVVPETLPQPFLDIARNCLRRDPQRRWTLAEIRARLEPSLCVVAEQTTARPPKSLTKWRYIVPTAVGLALLAILAATVPRRRPDVPRVPSSPLEQPEVKRPTGGLVRGAAVNQVVPDVPQSARDTIRGAVRVTVRVAVDPSGNVTGATLDSPGPSKYFADLALRAARSWKFRSPEIDGRSVASEWILRFQFESAATKVVPQEAAPQ